MKILSLILLVVVTLSTFAIAAPTEVKYEVKIGTVTFNHEAHATYINDCIACHHTGTEPVGCKTCHLATKGNAPKAKDAYHKQCKSCHKEMKQGPTKCKECHIK